MLKSRLSPSHRLLLARAAVLIGIVVLVCVPGLTRMGQKLETASRTPSFAKNIDCPPKKVTIAAAVAVALPVALKAFESVPSTPFPPALDSALLPPRLSSAPVPLRAPPSTLLA